MRIQTKQYEVYTLDEVMDKAIEKQWDINVDYAWGDGIYDDAEMVGIKITEFDLYRRRYCKGTIQDCYETSRLIMDAHGLECTTYKLAAQFRIDRDNLVDNAPKDEDGEFINEYKLDSELDDLEDEFKRALFEEYSWMLQKEYEYLTSREAIEETLCANEYEFYVDGSIA